jgi:SecD/SecF fusion protein
MKTIIYFIINSVICITLTSGTQKTSGSGKTVLLQATSNNPTTEQLTQSVKVISERLKTYGLKSFDVSIPSEKDQIKVQLPDNVELSEIEGLLTSKGELAFYETYTRKEITGLVKNNNQLFDLLISDPKASSSDSKIGCTTPENKDLVDQYLQSNKIGDKCKFLWEMDLDKSQTCLYALKTETDRLPLLERSDVGTIKSLEDKKSSTYMIEMAFKPASSRIWAEATKNNLNKSIAIVIDDKVFYTPIVKVPMENGLCEISGNLSLKDVSFFLALVNNENLPLGFEIK